MVEPFLRDLEAVILLDFIFGEGIVEPHAFVSEREGNQKSENEDEEGQS